MPKIDYSELNGLRLTVQSARLAILSKFTDFEKTVSAFSEETNLSGSSWESAKAYLTQLPAVSRGIFNVLSDFGEQLNAYLEAFQSEVGSPKNRLDSEHLSELNTRLQGIRQEKESILASIRQATQLVQYGPGSTMFGTSFGDMGVTALENSMEDLTKDIEILEKYLSFEAAHGSDFDEVNALLEQLKTGISGFNRTVTFDSSTGDFIAPTAKNQAWYQAVVQLNEERPEVRKEMVKAYREKKDANGRTLGYEVVYEMYIDGELNRAETEKMTEMMKKAGLGELGVFVLEVTGVNNFRRYFNGVDPITGEKLTSNEKSLAGLFGLMDAIGTVEAIKLLKNLNKGYALLDGVKVPDTIKTEKFVGSGSFEIDLEKASGAEKVSGPQKVMSNADAEKYAFDATKGANNSDSIVLGKFDGGGPTAYTTKAKEVGAQYFELDNWDELSKLYNDKEIWKINEKFLDIQIGSGRDIYFSHNPLDFIGDGSFYSQEIAYLQSHGFGFEKIGDLWHVIR